ncbi:carboxypeptidase regulatory-like domain-containing protein [candidate division KSB1 bacterium]|nr:carboxypeptidase regulatory-like domain-containing protein [candidate division KSB1 bacterium]
MKTHIKYIIPVLALLALAAFFACTKVFNEVENIIITGSVTLEGVSDYSDITVALYHPAALDTAIVNMHKRFPSVGFELTQAAVFDHREAEPLYTTKTDKNGAYRFDNIPDGVYNIVAAKDGYGWRYIYNVDSKTAPANVRLQPEIVVEGILDQYTAWDAYQHIIVKGDVIVPADGQLIIDKGVVVRFGGIFTVEVRGILTTNIDIDDLIRLTGEPAGSEYVKWNGFRFENLKDIKVGGLKIEYCANSLSFRNCETISLNDCYTENNTRDVFRFVECKNVDVQKSINCNNTKTLYIQKCENVQIQNNFFVYNDEAMETEETETLIKNNYFFKNKTGLHIQFRPSPNVEHNQFTENEQGIFCAGSDPAIDLNNFNSNINGIYLGYEFLSYNSQPIINNNNFILNQFAVYNIGQNTNSTIPDINCKSNYWGTIIRNNIEKLIWDSTDIQQLPYYIGNIIFEPFANMYIDSSGIN